MFEYDSIKDFLKSFFGSRLFVISIVYILLAVILLQRLFSLQIIHGENYQNNFTLKIKKEKVLPSTRGNIYDCNGKLLAYNELTYKITIEDKGTYESARERNSTLNKTIAEVLKVLAQNGDSFVNDFNILLRKNGVYRFNVEGTALQRFRADIYGKARIDDLGFDKKLGYDTSNASEEQIIAYLQKNYGLVQEKSDEKNAEAQTEPFEEYEKELRYQIMVVRYALAQHNYQKYISTTIATGVSKKTMAYIKENKEHLQGVDLEDDYIRKYADSKYFASIIGYTGKISTDEYEALSAENENYTLTDVIGKAGIEQVMDAQLQGEKGSETVFVDNMGKEIETTNYVAPKAGNDVYLSINGELEKVVYDLLEQELAGILFSKIENIREYVSTGKASDIKIPIYDVYFALVDNNVVDTGHFTSKKASQTEKAVEAAYESHLTQVLSRIESQCLSDTPEIYSQAEKEYQSYYSYIVSMLGSRGILKKDMVDKNDETYLAWAKEETISLKEYLDYCVSVGWIDYNVFQSEETYSDSSEIYQDLISYIIETLKKDDGFQKKIFQYLIYQDMVTGAQLCHILIDQGVIRADAATKSGLDAGTVSAYDFLKEKIHKLEITPAQLALDPCTASCVLADTRTGRLLALVSYPGYDNNRFTSDAEYFAKLQTDKSQPLYNHATQERTAPGSTFKMVTATAGLTEGVISLNTEITCTGKFMSVDNEPTCWIYPSSHGPLTVSEAIRDSCNYFFYQVGYDLSLSGGVYSDSTGIGKISAYAREYGLGETTGIEIPENQPKVADEFPVMAAIGQSDHNYTTVQLSRYVTAVANSGTVFQYTLLGKVVDTKGNIIKEYKPAVKNTMDGISATTWNALHNGNRMVTDTLEAFEDFPIAVGGKTGTAQQIKTRGNHALFVGYAPCSNPQISIATRIAFGYTSHNAADVSARILKYYFHLEDSDSLLDGQANSIGNTSNGFAD